MAHKKSTKPHKKGSKKKKGSLKGTAALKASKKGVIDSLAKPSGVLVGFVLGSVASNLLEKVPFLATPAEDDGKFSIKKTIKPVILLGVGSATAILTHKKSGAAMQFVSGIGFGLAGAGVVSGVKAVTGKSLVSGLGEPGANAKALEATYYKEQANDLAKQLEEGKFRPNLDEEGTDGVGKTEWGTTMNADESGMVM